MDMHDQTKAALAWATLVVVTGILLLATLVPTRLLPAREARRLVLLDLADQEPGPWRGWPGFYDFAPGTHRWVLIHQDGETFLRLIPLDPPAQPYSGFGVGGTYPIPADTEMVLTWRARDSASALDLYVTDSPPLGVEGRPGEIFHFGGRYPTEHWQTERFPLEAFVPNAWQEEGAWLDGVMNTLPLVKGEIGFATGGLGALDLRYWALEWRVSPWPLVAYLGGLALMGLALLLRAPARVRATLGGGRDLATFLTPRLAWTGMVGSFFLAWITWPDLQDAWGLLSLHGFAALAAVAEDFLPPALARHRPYSLRYLPFTAAFVLAGSPLPYPAYMVLLLVTFLPAALARDRMILGVLALANAALLVLRPDLQQPESLLFHGLALLATLALAYGLGELRTFRRNRDRMERAMILYQGIMGHSTNGIFTLDRDERITGGNRGLERLLGLDEEALLGRDIRDFWEDSPDRWPSTPEGGQFEGLLLGADGSRHEVLVDRHPLLIHGALAGYQVVATEISERRRLEHELREANARLEALVHLDGLTGINNRRHFDQQLEVEWRRAIRSGDPLALILIDIDHFKQYNDLYGHQAGDDVLIAVAGALKGALKRAGDLVARYGGEEFVALLPSTTGAQAQRVAHYLQEAVRALGIHHGESSCASHLTISAGIRACHPTQDLSPAEALRQADQALYTSKRAGRNRASLWEGDTDWG